MNALPAGLAASGWPILHQRRPSISMAYQASFRLAICFLMPLDSHRKFVQVVSYSFREWNASPGAPFADFIEKLRNTVPLTKCLLLVYAMIPRSCFCTGVL